MFVSCLAWKWAELPRSLEETPRKIEAKRESEEREITFVGSMPRKWAGSEVKQIKILGER